jgi:hypothetical protein
MQRDLAAYALTGAGDQGDAAAQVEDVVTHRNSP